MGKDLQLSENHKSFPPQMFSCIRYIKFGNQSQHCQSAKLKSLPNVPPYTVWWYTIYSMVVHYIQYALFTFILNCSFQSSHTIWFPDKNTNHETGTHTKHWHILCAYVCVCIHYILKCVHACVCRCTPSMLLVIWNTIRGMISNKINSRRPAITTEREF